MYTYNSSFVDSVSQL